MAVTHFVSKWKMFLNESFEWIIQWFPHKNSEQHTKKTKTYIFWLRKKGTSNACFLQGIVGFSMWCFNALEGFYNWNYIYIVGSVDSFGLEYNKNDTFNPGLLRICTVILETEPKDIKRAYKMCKGHKQCQKYLHHIKQRSVT